MPRVPVDAERVAELAKALSHPARVQIVELLARQAECRGAEVFAELPLAQSTVSEHLRVLKDAGIVGASPVGTAAVYCLDARVVGEFTALVDALCGGSCACASEGGCR